MDAHSGPMFPAICLQLARAAGENTLLPSPSLDESKRLLPLNVVTMEKKRKWILFTKIEYSTYDIPLADLLIDKHVLEAQVEESKFCSYNPESAYSLNGKFEAGANDIIAANVSASAQGTLTSKLGDLLLREIGYPSFMSALKNRKLDMDHHFIREIKDAKKVLCVIRGVITTSDKAQIKCTNKTEGNIKVSEKVIGNINAGIKAATRGVRDMVIEPGTILAYKVWKLKVDVNSGEMTPVMTKKHRGGFFTNDEKEEESNSQFSDDEKEEESNSQFSDDEEGEESNSQFSDDEDEVAATLQDLQGILQPLHHYTEADDQSIKSSLLDLMTCYSDVVAMSNILSEAENGSLNEDEDSFDEQFINNDAVWSILTFVGVKTEEGRVLHEGEASPIFIAVQYMIDAILEIEDDDLDNIYHFDEPQLKTLSKIFESALASSETISIDVDMSSVLNEPVSSFLTRQKFTVCNDSIQPPKAKTCIVECIFCVLYCLS